VLANTVMSPPTELKTHWLICGGIVKIPTAQTTLWIPSTRFILGPIGEPVSPPPRLSGSPVLPAAPIAIGGYGGVAAVSDPTAGWGLAAACVVGVGQIGAGQRPCPPPPAVLVKGVCVRVSGARGGGCLGQ